MKRFLIVALTGWVLSGAYTAGAALICNSTYHSAALQTREDRKAGRAYNKERRKAERAEYRSRYREKTGRSDPDRIMRENIRQRKKMDKAARKENRRNWGTNELGDPFGIY